MHDGLTQLQLQREATDRILRQYREARRGPGSPADAVRQVYRSWLEAQVELHALGIEPGRLIKMCVQLAEAAYDSLAGRPVYWQRYRPLRRCGRDDGTGWPCGKLAGHITDHDVRPVFADAAQR